MKNQDGELVGVAISYHIGFINRGTPYNGGSLLSYLVPDPRNPRLGMHRARRVLSRSWIDID
jgi:hypothetical protein